MRLSSKIKIGDLKTKAEITKKFSNSSANLKLYMKIEENNIMIGKNIFVTVNWLFNK